MAALVSVLSWLCFSALIIPSAKGQGNGAVRFFQNGQTSLSYTSGIVEVYYNGQWGNICYHSSFGISEATVVCHQLGYSEASSYTYAGSDTSYGTDYSPFVIGNVSCSTTSYLTILQCSYSSEIDSTCKANIDDVIVTCYTTRIWDDPYSGQIRLNGTQYITNGLIEVYCNGQWGTICDDYFNSYAADTVCLQLGYTDYVSYDSEIYQGYPGQPIWLTNVYCSYSYSCLSYCASCPSSQVTNCAHSEDVDVVCEYKSYSSNYVSKTYTCDFDSATDLVGLIVGVTIAVVVVVIALVVGISICICCCIGVGAGAAVRLSNTRTTFRTAPPTTTAAVSTTFATQQGGGPPHVHNTTAYYSAMATGYPPTHPTQPMVPQTVFGYQPPPYPGAYQMQEYKSPAK